MDDLLKDAAPPRTIDDLIKEAEAEIVMRQRVYAGFVRKGTMTQAVMDEKIARMSDIRDVLKAVKAAAAKHHGGKVAGWGESVLAALNIAVR